jgi:hypothetical protein
MPDPVDEQMRRPAGRGNVPALLWLVASIPPVLGLGLLALEKAPGVAWPLVVCGAGFISILVAGRSR